MCLGIFRLVQSLIAIDPTGVDFHGFYASAYEARTGQPWPEVPPNADLNPPTFGQLLIPLSLLPLRGAWFAWWIVGAVSLVATLRLLHRRGLIPAHRWPWIIGALALSAPAMQTWSHGQIAWLLLYPITRAWLSPSPVRAGLWLAPVIAIKPPIAMIVLLLPERTWAVAGAVSATICALDVALVGLGPWAAWLERSLVAPGLRMPANASYFGIATRISAGIDFQVPATIRALPWAWWVGWAACAAVTGAAASRAVGTRRWIVALAAGTFLQPLGWTYYVVWWLGPMLAAWRSTPPVLAGAALLVEPLLIILARSSAATPFYPVTLSLCAVGVVLLGLGLYCHASRST